MKKWFFSDFDGTLRNSRNGDLKLNSQDHEFVNKFMQNGNTLVVATARPYMQIKKFLKDNYDLEPNYLICSNGSCAYDKSGKLLFKITIEKDDQKEIIELLKLNQEHIIGIIFNTPDKEAVLFHKKWNDELTNAYFGMTPENGTIDHIEDLDILTMRIAVNEELREAVEELVSKRKETLDAFYWNIDGGLYLDFTNVKTTKGNAIRGLQKIIKFEDKHVIVAGDDVNDLSMFEEFYENSYIVEQERNIEFRHKAKNIIEQIHQIEID